MAKLFGLFLASSQHGCNIVDGIIINWKRDVYD